MRTGIIISTMWLVVVLALAPVQGAETAPPPADPNAATQANGTVVVTLENQGGTTQATVTQPGNSGVVVGGLTVQVQTVAAADQPAAAEKPPTAVEAPPAPQASAPAAGVPAPSSAEPAAVEKPAEAAPAATGQPAEATPAAPAVGTVRRPSDASSAGRRRFTRGQLPAAFPQARTAAGPAPAMAQGAPAFDRFQVLAEKNIFSRVRGNLRPARTGPVGPPPPPQRYLTLTGTLGGENGYVAFIEDSRAGETLIHQVGDTVGQGRITAIGADGMTYEQNGKAIKIALGDYVGGAPPAGPAPAGVAAPAAPGAASSGAASDVAERLRQRRLKEEGQ